MIPKRLQISKERKSEHDLFELNIYEVHYVHALIRKREEKNIEIGN